MKKYEFSFYAPNEDREWKLITKAAAEGKNAHEAAPEAYESIKSKYPQLRRDDWLAMEVYSLEPSTPE